MDSARQLGFVDPEDGIDVQRQGAAGTVTIGWSRICREHVATLDDEHLRIDLTRHRFLTFARWVP
jgi:hypothetical protein